MSSLGSRLSWINLLPIGVLTFFWHNKLKTYVFIILLLTLFCCYHQFPLSITSLNYMKTKHAIRDTYIPTEQTHRKWNMFINEPGESNRDMNLHGTHAQNNTKSLFSKKKKRQNMKTEKHNSIVNEVNTELLPCYIQGVMQSLNNCLLLQTW